METNGSTAPNGARVIIEGMESRIDPHELPPGPARRSALLDLGRPVGLGDFAADELTGLMRDLNELRTTVRHPQSAGTPRR